MIQKKAAIFCSHGLGDGLLFLLIANSLKNNSFEVVIFQDVLKDIKDWFDDFDIRPFSSLKNIKDFLEKFDLIIINQDHLKINREITKIAKENFFYKTFILKPSSHKGKRNPFDLINPEISMVQNLQDFCSNSLKLQNVIPAIGILPKKNLTFRQYSKKIIIHADSKREDRSWDILKFLKLAEILRKKNFLVCFIINDEKKIEIVKSWGFLVKKSLTLKELFSEIYESGYLIGNDSGLGHLASSMKIPTLTIFTSKRKQKLWRPDFYLNMAVTPYLLLPNIKGLRLRNKYWDKLITVRKVFKKFKKLRKIYEKMCSI